MSKPKWGHSLLGLAAIALLSSPSLAVVSQQFFISDNNKLYYVIASNPSTGEIGTQVTSLVMTSGTARAGAHPAASTKARASSSFQYARKDMAGDFAGWPRAWRETASGLPAGLHDSSDNVSPRRS